MLMIQHSVEISVVKIKYTLILWKCSKYFFQHTTSITPNCPTRTKGNSNNIYSHNLLNKIAKRNPINQTILRLIYT